jgi:hypothetical protein
MIFSDDRETFAAQRSTALEEGFDALAPRVEEALRAFGGRDWYVPILSAARDVWDDTQEAEGSDVAVTDAFIRSLRESLDLTTAPSDPPDEGQVRRIANWVAVYAVNASTMASAQSDGGDVALEWITMRDEDVRDLHRPLQGVRVAAGDTFSVGQWDLQYPGQPVGDPEAWINCRCVVRPVQGEQMSAQTFATEMDDTILPADDEIPVPEEEMPPMVDWAQEMMPVPIHGVLIDTTEETGDGRHLAGEFTVLSVEDGPVPLRWVQSDVGEHNGAVRVATIDQTWTEGSRTLWNGHLLEVEAVSEVLTLLAEGRLGLSVDLDSAVFEVDESGDEPVMRFSEGRIRAATLVDIPALTGAWAELGSWEDTAVLAAAGCEPCQERMEMYRDKEALAVNDIPEITKDAPGWLTNPRDTSRLRNYWATGPGAAKINWGVPGDFNRCRALLSEYVPRPDWLAGLCANIHYDAIGVWPGQEIRANAKTLTASAFTIYKEANVLPAEWFTDPELTAPTPSTVTPEGRTFGHIAQWGVCHTGLGLSVGMDDSCTAAPTSPSNYAYYRTGVVDTDQGEIPVGNLTMGIGHAGERVTAGAAIAHYDNTNAVVADVVTGEDEHGIWFSGAMRENLTDEQIRAFKASTLSGDWRQIGGEYELVAALAVNVPGFPIPRLALAASGGRLTSLIAAGIVPREEKVPEPISAKEFAKAVREEMAFQDRTSKAKAKYRAMERARLAGRL